MHRSSKLLAILLKDQLFQGKIVLSDYNILPLGPINEQKDMLEDQKTPKTWRLPRGMCLWLVEEPRNNDKRPCYIVVDRVFKRYTREQVSKMRDAMVTTDEEVE